MELTRAEMIQVLVLGRRSRKAIKRFLNDRDLPADADGVDAVLAHIASQPDAETLRAQARQILPPPATAFSLVDQLTRILTDRGFAGEQAISILSRHARVDPAVVQRFMAGQDIPLATVDALFRAAGAMRVLFRDPAQRPKGPPAERLPDA